MSENLSLLEQYKHQHASFIAQREQANNNLQQLAGAIYACDLMIRKFEDEESKSDIKPIEYSTDDPCYGGA